MATSPDFTLENFERFLENLKNNILPKYASKSEISTGELTAQVTKEAVIKALGYTPEEDLTDEQIYLLENLKVENGILKIKNLQGIYVDILENSTNVYATQEDIDNMFK